jgi:hypothetical protein
MLCTELSRLRVGQFISIHPMARHFNPSNGAAGGPVVVDVTSGDTGNTGRDRKMHQEILESQRYPEITFTPSRMSGKVEPEGDSKVQVDGIVRLHGSDHVMTLTLPVQTKGNSLSVRTHIVIPYVEWGAEEPKHVPASRRRQGGGRCHRGGPGSSAGETSLSLSVVAFVRTEKNALFRAKSRKQRLGISLAS